MRKLATSLIALFISVAFCGGLHAQSLKNTAWKFYVDQLHDSLVFHIGSDSSYTTTVAGEVVIRSFCRIEKDTMKIKDFEGQYNCPDGEGVYRYSVEGDVLNLFLITDPCPTRAEVLNGVKCKKTPA